MANEKMTRIRHQIYPSPKTNPSLAQITEAFRLQANPDPETDSRRILTFVTDVGTISVVVTKLEHPEKGDAIYISGRAVMGGITLASDSPTVDIIYHLAHRSGHADYCAVAVE